MRDDFSIPSGVPSGPGERLHHAWREVKREIAHDPNDEWAVGRLKGMETCRESILNLCSATREQAARIAELEAAREVVRLDLIEQASLARQAEVALAEMTLTVKRTQDAAIGRGMVSEQSDWREVAVLVAGLHDQVESLQEQLAEREWMLERAHADAVANDTTPLLSFSLYCADLRARAEAEQEEAP